MPETGLDSLKCASSAVLTVLNAPILVLNVLNAPIPVLTVPNAPIPALTASSAVYWLGSGRGWGVQAAEVLGVVPRPLHEPRNLSAGEPL